VYVNVDNCNGKSRNNMTTTSPGYHVATTDLTLCTAAPHFCCPPVAYLLRPDCLTVEVSRPLTIRHTAHSL